MRCVLDLIACAWQRLQRKARGDGVSESTSHLVRCAINSNSRQTACLLSPKVSSRANECQPTCGRRCVAPPFVACDRVALTCLARPPSIPTPEPPSPHARPLPFFSPRSCLSMVEDKYIGLALAICASCAIGCGRLRLRDPVFARSRQAWADSRVERFRLCSTSFIITKKVRPSSL